MLDFEYLQNKLKSLNASTSSKKSTDQSIFWKPSGTHTVRLLPYIHDLKNPFIEIYNYYKIGGRSVITSPISFGLPDPIFEFAQKLQGTGNRQDYTMGKSLEPKRRTHAWVLVRGQEHEGPKLWGFSDTVYKELLATVVDPDYGNVLDAQEGRDMVVEFTPKLNENAFDKTITRFKPKTSPITDSPDVIELIKNMPKIESVCKPPSYEELTEVLEAHLNVNSDSDEGPANTNVGAPQSNNAVKVQTPPPSKPGSSNVESALNEFEKLFSNSDGASRLPF